MDWDYFVDEELIAKDEEVPRSKKILNALHEAGHALLYVTGREQRLERATVAWLARHGFPPSRSGKKEKYIVYMRANGDARSIAEVKRDLVDRLLADVAGSKVGIGPLPAGEKIVAFENNLTTRAAYEARGIRFFPAPECWKEVEQFRDLFVNPSRASGSNEK
jgi:hypothetical protein